MPSTSFFTSAAVLALSGMAAAFPGAPYAISNGTNGSAAGTGKASGAAMATGLFPTNTTSSAGAKATGDALFCPKLNGQIFLDGLKVSYLIECNTNHFGTTFDIDIDITPAKKSKRAAATSLADCLAVCDASSTCVGTAFDTALGTCTYFSDVQAVYTDAGVDFAIKVANGATTTTVAPGDLTTSTVFSTSLSTILSCAPTVTNCPLRGSVVTDVVVDYTTVCPATAAATLTLAAAPVACSGCPYSAGVATVYSTTVTTISKCPATVSNCPLTATTTVVPVSTIAVNYPLGTSTGVSTKAAVTVTSTVKSATGTSTGLVSFTGAADSVKAGMGMAAMFVGAAMMI